MSSSTIAETDKPVLVLDLDETLIYSTQLRTPNTKFTIRCGRYQLFIQTRPGLENFLNTVKPLYDIYFFTSSKKEYANQIIDKISPDTPESHRHFSDSILSYNGCLAKNLDIFQKDFSRIILVDNSPSSGILQPNNFLGIIGWFGEENDSVLENELTPLLISCASQKNLIRSIHTFFLKSSPHDLFLLDHNNTQ